MNLIVILALLVKAWAIENLFDRCDKLNKAGMHLRQRNRYRERRSALRLSRGFRGITGPQPHYSTVPLTDLSVRVPGVVPTRGTVK